MKSPFLSSILIVFLSATLQAEEAQNIRISNIQDGQVLTGEVRVELAANDLDVYRRVSFYMDGQLVRNVHLTPFSLVMDSRDFVNGRHVLEIRALHSDGPIHIHRRNVGVKNDKKGLNLVIKNPRCIVAEDQVVYRSSYIDAPHPVLKKNEEEFYYFHNLGLMMHQRDRQGITYCTSGPPEEPYRNLEWTKYVPELWDKNGHSTQGIWLMGLYKIGEDELLGFTHSESCYDEAQPCNRSTKAFTVGIGYSGDNGKSWTYCGDAARPAIQETSIGNNMGGLPYLLVDGYFYIYFQEYLEKGKPIPGVARAKKEEVIQAARKGSSVKWTKYYRGQWNQDALTGRASNVMENLGIDFNMHAKAAYLEPAGIHLMLTYERGTPDLYFLGSKDGLKWEIIDVIKDPNSDKRVSYPFFVDSYSDDSHKVDHEFHVFWTPGHRELWGARVLLDQE